MTPCCFFLRSGGPEHFHTQPFFTESLAKSEPLGNSRPSFPCENHLKIPQLRAFSPFKNQQDAFHGALLFFLAFKRPENRSVNYFTLNFDP